MRKRHEAAGTRSIGADLVWGIRAGLVIVSVALIPALVVSAGTIRPGEVGTLLAVVGAYLAAALIFGAIAGFARPHLARRSGAALVGALIGGLAIAAIVCVPRAGHAYPGTGAGLVSVAVGFVVGAVMGLRTWTRFRA